VAKNLLIYESDTRTLYGLNLAAFILEGLTAGHGKHEIIAKLYGDEQLFDMWFLFLVHNHWLEKTSPSQRHKKPEWVITDKGKAWVERLERAFQDPWF
jgi:hypothetical protein